MMDDSFKVGVDEEPFATWFIECPACERGVSFGGCFVAPHVGSPA
jgi:hypothetical protein